MKKIAVLTSGGDAPGMNACIRSVVLTAQRYGIDVIGYLHGYNGPLKQEYIDLNASDVANIIQRGGTVLHSARCLEFKTDEAAKTAAANLDELGVEALLVIGGDGSFRGAAHLANFWSGQVIGLPGTIDNDIYGSDATIGFYTAVETAVSSIDKVRDTADAFERVFLIEVMGRNAGFIGLAAAVASSADHILLPELFRTSDDEMQNIMNHLLCARERHGNNSYIVVVTENIWPGGVTALADELSKKSGSESRPVILGHVQRGGSPVTQDRLLATKLGAFAVEAALAGETNIMVGEQDMQVVTVPLEKTWKKQKALDPYLVKVATDLFDETKIRT
ncbi:6-phosphofructokinase [Aestuariibacter salexigens]|uniref:6-phosphofructokinase n=1 Tax=Aestuariibacter salexigens TaxID=226010 RepID=UPI0004009D3D|nr:ATP-dependent 6-phosphofructokinase [Aestuariibacter salexigens]